MQSRFFLLIVLFLISPFVLSSELVVKISSDLPGKVSQNIEAYLGALPDTESERNAFIFSAKKQTLNALKALGYYRAEVTNSIDKNLEKNIWTLSINVVLNQPTKISKVSISIRGDAFVDSAFSDLIRKVPMASGDNLHHGVYEQFKTDLVSLGLERGYFDSKFIKSNIAINKNLDTADIIINFDSGPRYLFGEINLI